MFFPFFVIAAVVGVASAGDVIYAVNAGGGGHTDSNGIRYIPDPLSIGVASDYGQRFQIRRALAEDQNLYQTERWHSNSFSYEIPVKEDGDYVIVMKFAEVYFDAPEQKVFSVQLNNQHVVVPQLDIFEKVGHATAHDEVVEFSVKKGKLEVGGESSSFNNVLTLELLKGHADNPKICAFYVMKGRADDVPALPSLDKVLEKDDEDEEDAEDEGEDVSDQKSQGTKPSPDDRKNREKLKSGPPAINPYAEDSGSLVLPIIVAFCAFIPTLICLCRL